MSYDYINASTVSKLSSFDDLRIFAAYVSTDSTNDFNDNIHFHSFYELEFITSGTGIYKINNKMYDIGKGALFLTTPADYHTYSLQPEEKVRLFNLQFYPSLLCDEVKSILYKQTEPIALCLEGQEYDEIFNKLNNIVEVYSHKKPMYEIVLRNEIENLCISLIYMLNTAKSSLDEHYIIRKVIIYVRDNYRRRLTLDEIAEYVGLSKYYLSRIFSAAMGISLSAYIRNVRLDVAANLLKSSEMSVKEISYKTGFKNANYFTDAFTKKFMVSPSEYRKSFCNICEQK